MRLFLDTANLEQIKQGVRWGITGVTTNPSLVSAEGIKDYKTLVQTICGIVPGEVSAEVWPFVICILIVILAIVIFPGIAMWLPRTLGAI